jgi:hypothetical protein
MTTSIDKHVRMALRRDVGNRVPPAPKAKAIGPARLYPYACLNCRKSFKRRCEDDLPDKTCPNCHGIAVGLSRNFKAPAMGDIQQWQKVALLLENGFRFFHQYNANGALVRYPSTMAEAKDFVALYRKTPNSSIEGMPKRLRLFRTPHVKR